MRPAIGMILLGCLLFAGLAVGNSQTKSASSYAVISGTVFRDTGLSLPRAEITLAPEAAEPGKKPKQKKLTTTSDSRGEYSFRVPAGPAVYKLTVAAEGYLPQEKSVSIAGEERIDVIFRLDPASK